ncbi:hypothetical protein PSPO01_16369 [Paraphaeosphaeria sporulosa]
MPHPSGRPTGHRVQASVLQAVLEKLRAGHSKCSIQRTTGVACSTTRRIKLSMEYFGQPYGPPGVRIGRPPILGQFHRDKLLEHLRGKPTTYLDELEGFLYDDFDLRNYTCDQIVCLDESPANERTGDRKYGWLPVNSPIDAVYSARCSERWSVLPAMDVSGYLTHLIYQGAITTELMEDFMATQVLPHCNP